MGKREERLVDDTLRALESQPFSAYKDLFERKPKYREVVREIIKDAIRGGMCLSFIGVPRLAKQFPEMPGSLSPDRLEFQSHYKALEWMLKEDGRRERFKEMLLAPSGYKDYGHDGGEIDLLLNSPAFRDMRLLDIGTSKGTYSARVIDAIGSPLQKVVRTNISRQTDIVDHPRDRLKVGEYLTIAPYNVAGGPLDHIFDVVLFKDVSKYLTESGREKAFRNLVKMTEPGSIVLHGNEVDLMPRQVLTGFKDGQSSMEIFVHHGGELVPVDPLPFIKSVAAMRGRAEYRKKLPGLVKRMRTERKPF